MPQYMSVEVSGEMVTELMNDDADFMTEVLQAIAEYSDMGMLKDNAADLAARWSRSDAEFISARFIELGTAMRNGFNMANVEQIPK